MFHYHRMASLTEERRQEQRLVAERLRQAGWVRPGRTEATSPASRVGGLGALVRGWARLSGLAV
jgi:hypothetical protein